MVKLKVVALVVEKIELELVVFGAGVSIGEIVKVPLSSPGLSDDTLVSRTIVSWLVGLGFTDVLGEECGGGGGGYPGVLEGVWPYIGALIHTTPPGC